MQFISFKDILQNLLCSRVEGKYLPNYITFKEPLVKPLTIKDMCMI